MADRDLAFARRLRAFRANRTLTDIARALGVSPAAIKHYEEGRIPRPDILRRLAHWSGRSERWWRYGEEDNMRIADPVAPYGALERDSIEIMRELEELLRVADRDIKRHLRQQIRLLWRALKIETRRAEG